MKENKLSKVRELKKIVEGVFGLDIMVKNRSRDRVDARIICAKILRESGYKLKDIGEILAKDHSTIIHYCNLYDNTLRHIPELQYKYITCLEMFGKEHELNPNYTKQELIKELLNTKKELSLLHLKYAKLNSYKDKKEMEESKWGRIYKLIKERTPNNMEEVVERRINAMFNTNYEYQET